MNQSAELASSSLPPDFAGVLADYANAEKKVPRRDFDGLEDDVAMLSYESTLRAQKPAMSAAGNPAQSDVRSTFHMDDSASGSEPNRKSASVTLRMSQAEADQLRDRATEAGMTVSAYLRECAFEVENLRAQVKQALAEMRSASAPPPSQPVQAPVAAVPTRSQQMIHEASQSTKRNWLSKIWPGPKRREVAA